MYSWNAPFELIKCAFWIIINVCNTPFELYNANNLNENKIVTTFKGVDKFISKLKVKMVN